MSAEANPALSSTGCVHGQCPKDEPCWTACEDAPARIRRAESEEDRLRRRATELRRAVSVALANLSPGIVAHTVLSEAAARYDHHPED